MLDQLNKPMEHFGPVNINFMQKIDPKNLFIKIYQAVINSDVKVEKIDNFKLNCDLKGKPF